MDPISLTLFSGAIVSHKTIERILGPTADYLGTELQSWVEKRRENVTRIFNKADKLLGDKGDKDGAVPPRVLRQIVEEGSYCEEDLTADYFAGVLASSRTEVSRDDRGAAFAHLISRLTSYEIRAHYILYGTVKKIFDGSGLSPVDPSAPDKLQVCVPMGPFVEAMDFSPREPLEAILAHSVFGLERERLIGGRFAYGDEGGVRWMYPDAKGQNLIFQPIPSGIELFLWAHGAGDVPAANFLKPEVQLSSSASIVLPVGAHATQQPNLAIR